MSDHLSEVVSELKRSCTSDYYLKLRRLQRGKLERMSYLYLPPSPLDHARKLAMRSAA
ncbi:MAG: hypothetical protein BECKG1743F_GA0114225_100794 [Candidatus Kentron sp. G]|nr:MAG: hypothetical protein BECKG1743F_GA0114225_100794 [Candidatus Kentron sp. G]VFM96526.1 MAG: hypothetical protein BECKG1743E_GA0114224_100662 [Candidatus Kentron sp. G]